MANANTHAQLPLHTDTSTLLMVDHRGGPRGAPRGCAGGHQASLQRARGHTPPCAAVPIPTAEPGPPAAPAAGPGTYWEAPLGHGRGGCPSLGHGSVQPGARGRHRVACDSGNRQPQNREAEPQAVGGLLPPAPHSQGRVGGPPPQTQNPWGIGVMGGCRGCFKQGLLPSPVQLLQTLPVPAMTTSSGMRGVPTQRSCTRAQPLLPPTTACGSCRASTAATCSRQWEEAAVAGRSH